MTLNELKVGEVAVITKVNGEGALRRRLIDMGIIPRTQIEIKKIAPLGDPIGVRIRGYELSLRVEDAKKIEISNGEVV